MAERVRDAMLAEAARPDGPMAAAPRLLRESLIFPYAWGTPLAARRFTAAGNAGLDQALRDPPLSTRQVLDPADTAPVEFVRLPLAELASQSRRAACTLGDDNVAGALTLRVLFESTRTARAPTPTRSCAAGAATASCRSRARRPGSSSGSRWDSPEVAERFAIGLPRDRARDRAHAPLSGAPEVVVRDRTAWSSRRASGKQRNG
jgi:hypothetical protein